MAEVGMRKIQMGKVGRGEGGKVGKKRTECGFIKWKYGYNSLDLPC